MSRVKRSVHARKKRRATLERTKGFRGQAKSSYKRAKEALLKADTYAYRDRRNRKRDFRRLWIVRINAAARQEGMSLQPVHARPEARRDRGRPQGARGHRRPRPRDVPTFCRESPGGRGRLSDRGHQDLSRAPPEGALFVPDHLSRQRQAQDDPEAPAEALADEARAVQRGGGGPGGHPQRPASAPGRRSTSSPSFSTR